MWRPPLRAPPGLISAEIPLYTMIPVTIWSRPTAPHSKTPHLDASFLLSRIILLLFNDGEEQCIITAKPVLSPPSRYLPIPDELKAS